MISSSLNAVIMTVMFLNLLKGFCFDGVFMHPQTAKNSRYKAFPPK
jgi:hypothetical protein